MSGSLRAASLSLYISEGIDVEIAAEDADGVGINLEGRTLAITFQLVSDASELVEIANDDITIVGFTATFTAPAELTATQSIWRWCMRDTSDNRVFRHGIAHVAGCVPVEEA